jgi:hypothetical protein
LLLSERNDGDNPLFYQRRSHFIVSGLSQLCDEFGFEALRAKLSQSPPPRKRGTNRIAGFERKFGRLEKTIGRLASEVSQMRSELAPVAAGALLPLHRPFRRSGSAIVSDFLAICAEFRGKRFSLLWRGGLDRFGALTFQALCDCHANTERSSAG